MPVHIYVKEQNVVRKKVVNSLSYIVLVIGALLLFWSFYPVISFELYSRFYIQDGAVSPVPQTDVASSLKQANSVLGSYNVFSNNVRDFTQAHLWFPLYVSEQKPKGLSTSEYTLSIPKLNISRARVAVGGEDLTKSLVQYLPQSLPGEYGNVAIFGHSTLPQLYNVTDYKTIFTYLPSLEKNDVILVQLGDLEYRYEVTDMFVVTPDKVSILEQRFDESYLTLVTCVPPGTYWKRLVVKAKLTKLP